MSVASGVGKIRVLPPEVVSRIAAGEVVERPAAVVKELVDNSLDAGSTRITVEVTDGGRKLIRVCDDGEGMTPADAVLAFQRHATSKLRSEYELARVRTLGFRGEALPSIASVSTVRLVTACRTEPVGIRLILAGGALVRSEEVAAPPGTQIEVEDLFFNTPARKKFLKTAATEFSHVCHAVQQAALAWPGTTFRLTHNGQEVVDYPAVSSRRDRILQVYGLRFAEQAVPVSAERAGIRVEGLAIQPMYVRAGRSPQDLIVNRRSVRNAAIVHAVYDAYGAYLSKGQHPQFVLFLDVDHEQVDVNVHPTKREIRFADQDLVFQAVRSAVRAAIGAEAKSAAVGHRPPFDSAQGRTPVERSAVSGELESLRPMVGPSRQEDSPEHAEGRPEAGGTVREDEPTYCAASVPEIVPMGQLDRTYLVVQVGSELHVIDQHTAHERVLYERLCRSRLGQAVPSQPLLIPETVEVPAAQAALLQRHLSDLEQAGLALEPFGAHTFVVRAVPAMLKPLDYTALVLDLADDMAQWNTTSPVESRLKAVMASLACHGAVRAGRVMELPEIKQLVEDWLAEGLPVTCPHGRRVALRLTKNELARVFGR